MSAVSVVALPPKGLADSELRAGLAELCRRGLLTCTRGRPGEIGATYALAWLPLDEADRHPTEVRQRHAANMRALRRSS